MNSDKFMLIFVCVIGFCFGERDKVINFHDRIKYKDCDDVYRSGYNDSGSYTVYLNRSQPLKVYCRFESGIPAISIMQQKYGTVNFARGWYDYVNGFGSTASDDYWSGLEHMKSLTDAGYHRLVVTLQDWKNIIKTIQYNYFVLGPANQRYPLHIGEYISSHILPDDFWHSNGMPFATIDVPDTRNCAVNMRAGWWYNYCTYALPTGRYYFGGPYTPSGSFYDGIFYSDWHGMGYSLKYIRMDLYHI
ncbi:fibrinogen-like protein 1 [Mercenaria mercenaria]|uniref:fibrinogen-like protein 1 n=1 Tax=Mercenaria mercenaria TaxID=6596 RepID=UPI00234E46D5|nr:fibrinogen-like protein 1 [Mercenaria mercenaria]